jgi:hypothetical protein
MKKKRTQTKSKVSVETVGANQELGLGQKPFFSDKVIEMVLEKFNIFNIFRIVLLYLNYKLVEKELVLSELRMVPISIGEEQYSIPLLVLLLFPIILNLGLLELILRFWKTKVQTQGGSDV